MVNVTFWGVRGSTPCPCDANMRYGGNTACVSIGASSSTGVSMSTYGNAFCMITRTGSRVIDGSFTMQAYACDALNDPTIRCSWVIGIWEKSFSFIRDTA